MTDRSSTQEIAILAELAHTAARKDADEAQRAATRAEFLSRVATEGAPVRRPSLGWVWALPAVAAAFAIGFWVLTPRSLSFELEGAPRDGSYVRAPSDRPVVLRFSDQTVVRAAPSARVRVEQPEAEHTRVLVERGRADVHVVHDAARTWTFVAGPFEVLVTGTRFALDWDPTREHFDLWLLEGSVEVRGGKGSGPVAVRAGQRFQGDAQRGSMSVTEAHAEAAPSAEEPRRAAPSAAPEALASAPAASPVTATSDVARDRARTPASGASDWQARITRGEFAGIVEDAQKRGIAQCLAACSPSDLRALSDAARYTGKSALAEESLVALRKRFGSGAGRDAAFLLGRLEEQRGAAGAAERWYDTYLREAGGGAFAAEALAGKMRTVSKLRGKRAAEPIARDYLRRFPRGVHLTTAREILGE